MFDSNELGPKQDNCLIVLHHFSEVGVSWWCAFLLLLLSPPPMKVKKALRWGQNPQKTNKTKQNKQTSFKFWKFSKKTNKQKQIWNWNFEN